MICEDCSGRGSWSVREETIDGEIELVHHFCFTCNGIGTVDDENDTSDFDLGITDEDD